MNYDPDRSLWLPSRRKFFFLGLAAGVAPFLPDVPKVYRVDGVTFERFIQIAMGVPTIQPWQSQLIEDSVWKHPRYRVTFRPRA
jgi:hypothetical protein